MLNRRHIRIKVMQSVYAFLQSKNEDLVVEEKFLYTNVAKLYELFILQLSLFIYLQKLATKRKELSNNSHLKSNINSFDFNNLSNNSFIKLLGASNSLGEYINNTNLNVWTDATEYIHILLDAIKESDIFKDYSVLKTPSFAQDKEFVLAIFKKIIAPNDKLASFYEDKNIGWVDDLPFVNTAVVKAYSKLTDKKNFVLDDLYKDEDDRSFVKKLFRKVILLHTNYDDEIDKKTPNWDYDRIAGIDLILIKMAITEFLHFSSIPTKVTINEYLEIAKDYSSDKSSFFINGVLDKIEKEYQKAGKINKIGRGLL